MICPFWKISPSGNPTILLRAADVPPARRADVAGAVMSPLHIGGEQVGYIRLQDMPRLDMMGGEFCLNATRAFAALLDELGMLTQDGNNADIRMGQVEVSGVDTPVAVRVTRQKDALPFAEACLHFEALPSPEEVTDGLRLVRVPGISHLVQEGDVPSKERLESLCSAQRRDCGLEQNEAVGHLWISRPERTASENSGSTAPVFLQLAPVVWVRDTATLCSESACGSGTLACALAEHALTGATMFSILQPSGIPLSVRIEKMPEGWDIWVGGPVRITARGETDLRGIL